MNRRLILGAAARHVRSAMPEEGTGHDWWHVYRVWKTSLRIAKHEKGADLFVVQLGALFHDIADWKFHGGDELAGERVTRTWLKKAGVDKETIGKVCHIVANVDSMDVVGKNAIRSLEGRIVQDADWLDALGAIGIARVFAFGGHKGRPLYDSRIAPKRRRDFASFKSISTASINHFYEKLLLLKGRMNTKEGRRLAKERDAFLRTFLKRFFNEWEGRE